MKQALTNITTINMAGVKRVYIYLREEKWIKIFRNRKVGNVLIVSIIYRETMKSKFFEEWSREIFLRY